MTRVKRAVLGVSAVLFIGLLLGSWPAQAQIPDDTFVRQVKQLIERNQDILEKDGYKRTHNPYYVKIKKEEKNEFFVTLDKDVEYAVIAVCDSDCTNVDVVLFDENNNQIDMDTKTDQTPVVQVTPRWTGEFRLAISVPGCNAKRCTVGISVYGR